MDLDFKNAFELIMKMIEMNQ